MKTLLLIDANSLLHRAYHALPPLTAKDGSPAGALYGVTKIMNKILREERPEYVAACFDRPEPTFRDEEYKEYKGKRAPTADELISQLIAAHDLFAALGVRVFDKAGFEADDCIATLAHRFEKEEDLQTVILTGDRDTLQLVRGNRLVVRAPRKGISDAKIYDEAAIKEEYGLTPQQIVDYKALSGDPSDNIKGVPGIGPKGAVALLSKYATVEDILAHPEDPATAKVVNQREAAEQSKRLVILRTDAPLDVSALEDLSVREDDLDREAYFSKLGFKSLTAGGEAESADKKAKQAKKEVVKGPPQGTMF
jgi:DNA polymerase-1